MPYLAILWVRATLAAVIRLVLGAVLPLLLLLASGAAQAGDKNPEVEACRGKAAGDACTFKQIDKRADGPVREREVSGACEEGECCELDYSKGSPPETVCKPCLACKQGAPVTAAPTTGSDRESPRVGDAQSDPPETPQAKGCGCGSARTVAPVLGLGLVFIGMWSTKRTRSRRSSGR
jgi:hypothetical protein